MSDLEAHAWRDYPGNGGLDAVDRAVFLARGGHAPGTRCPNELPIQHDPHAYWCTAELEDDDDCQCGRPNAATVADNPKET